MGARSEILQATVVKFPERFGIASRELLGVLGGMGPLATADFLRKLALLTGVDRDQDHIPVIALSIPQIPDRSDAIMSNGPQPLAAMTAVLEALEDFGASFIAIPGNTAHYWYDALSASTRLPIINIVDAVAEALATDGVTCGKVGVLATHGTEASGIYATNFARRGIEVVNAQNSANVMRGIRLAKAGRLEEASALFLGEIEALQWIGCPRVVLACTEIPVTLEEHGSEVSVCIDASEACIHFARGRQVG